MGKLDRSIIGKPLLLYHPSSKAYVYFDQETENFSTAKGAQLPVVKFYTSILDMPPREFGGADMIELSLKNILKKLTVGSDFTKLEDDEESLTSSVISFSSVMHGYYNTATTKKYAPIIYYGNGLLIDPLSHCRLGVENKKLVWYSPFVKFRPEMQFQLIVE